MINKFAENDAINIKGDSQRLTFVFNNLISNAIKYTEQGSVEIGLAERKEGMHGIYIKDTGIGIKEEDFEALFDEFKKVNHRINKSVDSVGLGLPIAKKITESHQGQIEVCSELGKGSTFTVYFPLSQPD